MKKGVFLWSILTISVVHAYAQTQQVSGKVTDAKDGTPLPGVTVRIKGTTTGTITDQNGTFRLNASPNDVLIVSFTGYFAKEQAVGQNTAFNLSLNQDEKSLDEVVVVGYGTQERRDITGSVSTVKGDAIKSLATPSFEKQLAGQVTGVQAYPYDNFRFLWPFPSTEVAANPTLRSQQNKGY